MRPRHKLGRYLKTLHEEAKSNAAFVRYMQGTVHNWYET